MQERIIELLKSHCIQILIMGPLTFVLYRPEPLSRKQSQQLPLQDTTSAEIQIQNFFQPAQNPMEIVKE